MIPADALLDALRCRRGVVFFVGAGGKKSAMYAVARAHPGRVGITATAHTERFPRSLGARVVIADGEQLLQEVSSARDARLVGFARACELPGRHQGVTFEQLERLHEQGGFDLTVVKADGARNRWIKAPAPYEPAVPPWAQFVVPVVSIQVVGRPLDERIAHRPERVAAVTGCAPGETLRPEHLGRWLASPEGALKGVGRARVTALLNMVDDAALEELALEAAHLGLAGGAPLEAVVLARLRGEPSVVRVLTGS